MYTLWRPRRSGTSLMRTRGTVATPVRSHRTPRCTASARLRPAGMSDPPGTPCTQQHSPGRRRASASPQGTAAVNSLPPGSMHPIDTASSASRLPQAAAYQRHTASTRHSPPQQQRCQGGTSRQVGHRQHRSGQSGIDSSLDGHPRQTRWHTCLEGTLAAAAGSLLRGKSRPDRTPCTTSHSTRPETSQPRTACTVTHDARQRSCLDCTASVPSRRCHTRILADTVGTARRWKGRCRPSSSLHGTAAPQMRHAGSSCRSSTPRTPSRLLAAETRPPGMASIQIDLSHQ